MKDRKKVKKCIYNYVIYYISISYINILQYFYLLFSSHYLKNECNLQLCNFSQEDKLLALKSYAFTPSEQCFQTLKVMLSASQSNAFSL